MVQVYISGLPLDVTEKEIAEMFGSIGIIKMDKQKRPPVPKVCARQSEAGAKQMHSRLKRTVAAESKEKVNEIGQV